MGSKLHWSKQIITSGSQSILDVVHVSRRSDLKGIARFLAMMTIVEKLRAKQNSRLSYIRAEETSLKLFLPTS
jgi:hypothetical protein